MNIQPSPISSNQWRKVAKALYYSASSGFVGGFLLSLAAPLGNQSGSHISITTSLVIGALLGGVVGALNTLAVTVKQLFTDPE